MRATGITRRIDDLGRVVVPKEIRRTLHIKEGDSLEIYTDNQGEIILKKYSPIAEMEELAKKYVESLSQNAGAIVAVTDRDHVIAVSGGGKKELLQRPISKELEQRMDDRENVIAEAKSNNYVAVADEPHRYSCEIIYPIIAAGDVVGSVALLNKSDERKFGDTEEALVAFSAKFLGVQMED